MWRYFKRLIKRHLFDNVNIEPIQPVEVNPKLSGTKQIGDIHLISIGENVSFGGEVILYANALIEIGDNTMVAYNVIFHTSTHDYNDHPMWLKRIDRPIKVGKHVWIGTGVIILPGVIIGNYAVIAAGSVVNANIPEGAIVAGNPARIIRYRDKSSYLKLASVTNWDDSIITKEGFLQKECKEK